MGGCSCYEDRPKKAWCSTPRVDIISSKAIAREKSGTIGGGEGVREARGNGGNYVGFEGAKGGNYESQLVDANVSVLDEEVQAIPVDFGRINPIMFRTNVAAFFGSMCELCKIASVFYKSETGLLQLTLSVVWVWLDSRKTYNHK